MTTEGWRGWDAYAPFYDWENAQTLGRRDVPFWRRLATRAGGPVLELGCGTGRVSKPLARAGIDLVGIDRSAPMLARAVGRRNRQSATRNPQFVRGDIRALPFSDASFPMVLAPYGILQSLTKPSDLTATLASVARVIAPAGRFAIDLVPDVPKWASIKHKKGALDAKRGKIFTRIIKELTVAARNGGGDPDMNPRLRTVIADAKAANMPADNIKRAIRKGTGEEPGVSYEEAQYEAYGPGGAAVIIDVLTDNKNRSVGELRHLLEKHGGNLAATRAVAWMFSKKGYIVIEKSKADEEKLMAAVLDAGADDLKDDEDNWEVLSAPDAFQAVNDAVKALGIEPATAKVSMIPQSYVKLEGKPAQQMMKLMDALDDHDDVQNVASNFDISEKEIEASLA